MKRYKGTRLESNHTYAYKNLVVYSLVEDILSILNIILFVTKNAIRHNIHLVCTNKQCQVFTIIISNID